MRTRLSVALAAAVLLVAALPATGIARDPARFERVPLSSLPKTLVPASQSAKTVKVILELAGRPVALHEADARAAGGRLSKAEKDAIRAQVKSAQDALKPALAKVGARVLGQFQDAYDGIKVMVSGKQLASLAALPGVVAVHPVTVFQRDNLVGVPFIGGSAAWTDLGLTGAGVKIADIDTGLDYYHADFGGSGNVADYTYGFAHDTAFPATNADGTTQAFPSAKVAGGYDLVGDDYNADPAASTYQPIPHPDKNPLDCPATTESVGHGTHTAGTAAGMGVLADGSTYHGPYTQAALESNSWSVGPGVAPEAQLYSFRVFGCQGSTDVVVDAIDMAVKAGVDVINMSLGSPFGPPDTPDAVASDNASLAGVVVVASAGNDGSNAYMVGSPSTADRALSVAAIDPTATFAGAEITTGAGTITMINANGAPGLPLTAQVKVLETSGGAIALGCAAGDYAGTAGMIVVTQRGDCDRVARAKFGQAAGSAAVIMANQAANAGTLPPFEGVIPGVTIPFLGARYEDQAALKALNGLTVTVDPVAIANPGYKKLAGFSSGGPASLSSSLKPEITAPGVSTLSAESGAGTAGQRLSGTSMAAPFTTGSAALVVQAHPDWTPAQVKAALIDTADAGSSHILGYNVRTAGAGVVQVQKAAATVAMAWTADGKDTLSFGYDPANAAYADTQQLTITNTGRAPLTYAFSAPKPAIGTLTATPASITIPAGSSRVVNVKFKLSAADVAALPAAETSNFGSLVTIRGTFTATPTTGGAGVYALHVPFLAVPRGLSKVTAAEPGKLELTGTTASGSVMLANGGIHAGNADVYAWGLHDASEGMPSNDIRDAGVQSLDGAVAGVPGDRFLVFAISTYGRWSNPSVNEIDVPIDENSDGKPDAWVIGIDFGLVSSGAYNGQYVSIVTDAAFNILDAWVATAPMNGSVAELPALAATDLGLTGAGVFRYGVASFSAEGYPADQVAGMATFSAFAPAVSQGQFVPLASGATSALPISVDVSKISTQPALGWLVVTLDDANGAAQADEVGLPKIPKK